jgi:hypothetical protein
LLAIVAPQLEAELAEQLGQKIIQRTSKRHSETIIGGSAPGNIGSSQGVTPEHSNLTASAYRARYYVSAFAGRGAS